jgi:hypothetical protein
VTSSTAAAEVLSRAYAARGAPPPPARSPAAPPAPLLTVQDLPLPAAAAADRRWLEERLKTRYRGLEDLGPGEPPLERWCVTLHRLVDREIPWTGGKTEQRLVRVWFFGPDPGAALEKARAFVEDAIRRARR